MPKKLQESKVSSSSFQENIPTVTSEKVRAGMLQGVEIALGLPEGSLPKPVYTRLQLWLSKKLY